MPWSYYRTVALIHKHKVKAGGVSLFYFSIFKGRQVIFLHLLICLFNISFTEVGKSFFQLHILPSLFNIFYSLQFLCKSFLQLLLRFEYLRHCPFSNPWFLCYCLFLLFFLCFLSSLLFCLNYFMSR